MMESVLIEDATRRCGQVVQGWAVVAPRRVLPTGGTGGGREPPIRPERRGPHTASPGDADTRREEGS
ncbi:hypothetical protein CK485_06485 [Streptomyces sp. ICBB 8177]|nr:hypothetical protein CK485_06485 [Streptomyces sp. ICBB 8177]